MITLEGKRIAVLGAGSVGEGWGNGKATAVLFARLGANVLCVDRNLDAANETQKIITAENGISEAFSLDVTQPDAGEVLVSFCNDCFDGLDVMHFNVGVSSQGGVLETSDEEWDRIFEINVSSAMRITRSMLPVMRKQRHGVLTYVSSLAAVFSGPYSYISYETSKAALCRLSRSVAMENAKFGIRANTILPGPIDTPHVQQYVDLDTDLDELNAKRSKMVPLGRQGTAWDIANGAAYLASDSASFVTGIDLRIDGGMSA